MANPEPNYPKSMYLARPSKFDYFNPHNHYHTWRNAMNLPRHLSLIVFLAVAACLMICGAANAQAGGKSLPELRAQAEKLKVGETTEAQVISLMGEPSKTAGHMLSRGGAREIMEVKKLIYGPENNIVILIDKSTGKVAKVNLKPGQ